MNRAVVVAASVALAVGAIGCTTTIRAEIAHAPAIPVRLYPSIIVLHRGSPLEVGFAQNLGEHLAQTSNSRVQVMDPRQIAATSPFPSGTVVVQLQVDSSESLRLDYVPTWGTACGWYACYTTTSAFPVTVPTLATRLTAQLRDGVTAQVEVSLTADEAGDAVRAHAVLDALYRDLVTWTDGLRERVDYRVKRVRQDEVDHAIEDLAHGRFHEARGVLERFHANGGPRNLKKKRAARYFYALAIARRFDPATMNAPEPHFGAAIEACEEAARRDDAEEIRKFRAQLERDRAEARAFAAMQADLATRRAPVPPGPDVPAGATPPVTPPNPGTP